MHPATMPAFAATAVFLAACSSSSATPPDFVGTWVGTYSFALADGSTNPSTETLVITRQEDGKQMRDPLTGTLVDGGAGIVLTETAGFYRGTIDGDTKTVVFTRVDADQHTAFEVVLTRQ